MIEQSEDALEAFFGGGSEPAEVADRLEAFGQDMLKEAVQEFFDGQTQGAGGAGGALVQPVGSGAPALKYSAPMSIAPPSVPNASWPMTAPA